MPIENWFPTPVYFNFVADQKRSVIQDEIKAVVDDLTQKDLFRKNLAWGKQNHSLSDADFKSNLFDEYTLNILKEEIELHIDCYARAYKEPKKFQIVNSWLTLTKPTEYTTVHNHGTSDMSGVYYFKTNGEDGSFYFMNPMLPLTSTSYLTNTEVVSYKPEVGKIILFPGWLQHGVRSNDTDDIRISLSFNVNFEK